jgi:thiol-disulfide isomerase/thioredoxin
MKRYRQYITPALFIIALAAYAGRSQLRNLFPPKMKFANTELTTVDDSKKITINDFKGSVVIVSCFQTWCMDCARETPALNELAATINSPAFKIVYITNEDNEKISAFRSRFASANILFAHLNAPMNKLGISSFPTTYLLNKQGEVVITKLEGYDWMKKEAAIKELIAE